MIIDGKAIARDIKDALKTRIAALPESEKPVLFIVRAGTDPATESFVAIKKKVASDIGLPVEEIAFSYEDARTESVVAAIRGIIAHGRKGGIVVQLPLPPQVDTESVLDAIPLRYDADVLGEEATRLFEAGELPIMPPVVGAFLEVLARHSVFLGRKKVAILGRGRLVGAPAAVWFKRMGADVRVFHTARPPGKNELQDADIIVSGIGKPWFLTPDMVKQGAVLLDAGTSEAEGKLAGDAHPDTASKCALFTPVPGGIGPITVAVLFQNILLLAEKNLWKTNRTVSP